MPIPGRSDPIGMIHKDAFEANQLGIFVIRKIGEALRHFGFAFAELNALFPRHLFQVAIIKHQHDQAWIGPLPPIF